MLDGVLGHECLVGATLDRLTHRCHLLEATGESYRVKGGTLPTGVREGGGVQAKENNRRGQKAKGGPRKEVQVKRKN